MSTDNHSVKVIANPQQNGSIEWRLAVDSGNAQGPGHYASVGIDKNHDGLITFQIVNTKTINFDNSNPFVVQPATTTPSVSVGTQFKVTGGQGTQTLTVTDTNQNVGEFYYALHLSNGDTVDPIIKNGGCCTGVTQEFWTSPTGIAIEVALVLLIIAVVMWRMSAQRRSV